MRKMTFPRIFLNDDGAPASTKQLDYIEGLLKRYTIVNHKYDHSIHSGQLDVKNASKLIKLLMEQKPFRIIDMQVVNNKL